MDVLFFPYGPRNPYQSNLATALRRKGIAVSAVKDTSFTNLKHSVANQDILHLHWTSPYLINPKISKSMEMAFQFLKILTQQKRRGRKLVWTIHNLGEHERRHPGFELFCHRLLARLVDGIIVHSRYAREQATKAYRLGRRTGKIHIIPHGNYIGNYPNDISRGQARAELHIGAEKKVFLFLGQIRPYKGVPGLISAFKKIAQGNEVLILAGKPLNDEIEIQLKQLVGEGKDIIYSPKFVEGEEIQVFMKAADAVVFPFEDIFTSGSVLLAMSFAKTVIAPDLESLAEIREIGGTISYDLKKQAGLEEALSSALSADLEEMGLRNFQAAQKLSWELIAEKTVRVYQGEPG